MSFYARVFLVLVALAAVNLSASASDDCSVCDSNARIYNQSPDLYSCFQVGIRCTGYLCENKQNGRNWFLAVSDHGCIVGSFSQPTKKGGEHALSIDQLICDPVAMIYNQQPDKYSCWPGDPWIPGYVCHEKGTNLFWNLYAPDHQQCKTQDLKDFPK